jgi:hypothetical protein
MLVTGFMGLKHHARVGSSKIAPEVLQAHRKSTGSAIVAGLGVLVNVHNRFNVLLSGIGRHSHVIIGSSRCFKVAHDVHFLGDEVTDTHPNGKSSLQQYPKILEYKI